MKTLTSDELSVFGEICTEIAGGASLKKALTPKTRPSPRTWQRWLGERDPDGVLRAQYHDAQRERAASLFEEAIAIAHGGNRKDIARARLRVDTLMRAAGKLDPLRFGDKQIHAGDKRNPVEVKATVDVSKVSDAALKELMEARRAGGQVR